MSMGCRLKASLYWSICQTWCGIAGTIILSVGLVSNTLMMRALAKVPGWSQAFPWLPPWDVVKILSDYWLRHTLDIQRCDDTLSWATLVLGCTSELGTWRCPYQVICYLLLLWFFAHKATGSALLRRSILIWHTVYIFLHAPGGPWFFFWYSILEVGVDPTVRDFLF